MATNDLVPLPRCDIRAERPERLKTSEAAASMPRILKRILKKNIFFLMTAMIVFAVLLAKDPRALFWNGTATLATSATGEGTDQSMPTIQTTASAQALPPTEKGASSSSEIAAAFETGSKNQTESVQLQPEALLNKFGAWAAEEDARARAELLQRVQDAPAQVAQNARADVRPVQRRQVGREHHVRPQIRQAKNARVQNQSQKGAAAQAGPPMRGPHVARHLQNALAQERVVQDSERQWHEHLFDWLR